jgi:AcrR family transcriptional regulator
LQQIVDGACRLFFKKGYHGTTIREIAIASGMSMGQLYHYISSKDDVLFLIYKHMQMIWYEKLFLFIYTETKYLNRMHLQVVLEMDDKNVVGLWRRLLIEVNQEKLIDGDADFLANLLSYLMVFLPLRGWNLKHKATTETIDSLVKFVLKGLGIEP